MLNIIKNLLGFGPKVDYAMLLKQGAVANLPDARGKTSLDHAIMQENEQMISLLEKEDGSPA